MVFRNHLCFSGLCAFKSIMKTTVRKKNSWIVTEISDKSDVKTTKSKRNKGFIESAVKSDNTLPKLWPTKTTEDNVNINPSNGGSVVKNKEFKSNRFRDKCFANRKERGMILLSSQVENKIYRLKKALRKKGLNELEIKDIINKKRREEENRYYRDSKERCFKCRKFGHRLADCPQNTDDCEEGVDVCYRCGSGEHKLSECKRKSNDLPFAKCFLCSQIGHLTRDCGLNTRGVYPKGGSCKACDSVNHLIKDCPLNQKEEALEKEITLNTFEANHSVDAEQMDSTPIVVKTESKQKVIKF